MTIKTGYVSALFLLLPFFGAQAQKSHYFTYDREKIEMIMDQISETTADFTGFASPLPDFMEERQRGAGYYFLAGSFYGCVGSGGGLFLAALADWVRPELAVPVFITAAALGIITPAIYAGRHSKDPKMVRVAVTGSLTGMAIGLGSLAVLYLMGL